MVLCLILVAAQGAATLGPLVDRAAQALREENWAAAEEALLEARRIAPQHPAVLANLGVLYSRTDRYGEAVRHYQLALKQAPGDQRLLLNLALAHFRQENCLAALPVLRKIPGSRQARELEAACLVLLDRAGEAVPLLLKMTPDDPSALYLLGLAHLKSGERDKARLVFQTLFERAISPAQAHYLAGKAQYESGHFDEALESLRRALELAPRMDEARLELAKTLISLRRNEEAEGLLKEILSRQPRNLEALYFTGALCALSDRLEEAKRYLDPVLRAKPDFWGAHYYLGRILTTSGRYREALPHLERAVSLNPEEMSAWYQLARAARGAGQAARAREALDRYESIRARKVTER
ncbi:MAG: hypothetical protein KatS3mg005_0670 [Bryobacteraceae bacterium]|nr:MAG: hypothetical protein KatS3mg005_0670 [Bryobacteraceae bacterium]